MPKRFTVKLSGNEEYSYNNRARELNDCKHEATVMEDYSGKKHGRKTNFWKERRAVTRSVIRTTTRSNGTVNMTTETTVENQAPPLPIDDNISEGRVGTTSTPKKQRPQKIKWCSCNHWPILKSALEHKRKTTSGISDHEVMVPRSTINSALKQIGNKEITYENVFSSSGGLLSHEAVGMI
eukprot:11366663-Ditylum_brightwellii.AAC.1